MKVNQLLLTSGLHLIDIGVNFGLHAVRNPGLRKFPALLGGTQPLFMVEWGAENNSEDKEGSR